MNDMVSIPKAEYDLLIEYAKQLKALQAGGVDNWEYYYEALRDAGLLDFE